MSAPNPVSSPAGDLRPSEPSMEEILASIRRIIADDQSFPDRPRVGDETAAAAPAPASIHVLHPDGGSSGHNEATEERTASREPSPQIGGEAMSVQGIVSAPQYASPAGPIVDAAPSEVVEVPPASEPHLPFEPVPFEPARPEPRPSETRPSETSVAAAPEERVAPPASAPIEAAPLFSAATNSSVASAFNVLAASRLADNSEDLLGLAREMIRPLLRAWLDDNLPRMVERMVRDEIERVARGGH